MKKNRPELFRCFCGTLCLILSLLCAYCSSKKSNFDDVKITKVNTYFTDTDAARGMKKTLETTMRVIMPHQVHEKADITCVTCHHKFSNDERIKQCSYCHKGLTGAEMFHNFCIPCHAKKQSGPRRCNECHIERTESDKYKDIEKIYRNTFKFTNQTHSVHESADVKCDTCHHDGKGSKKKKKCNACHVGKSNMIILHSFCKDCHKKEGGPIRCQQCHVGVKSEYQKAKDSIALQKTGHRLPQIIFNHKAHIEEYNTECIDCHHLGSIKKCSDCHTNKDVGAVINIKGAYHQQCHECHRRTAGPQGCSNCHHERKKQ